MREHLSIFRRNHLFFSPPREPSESPGGESGFSERERGRSGKVVQLGAGPETASKTPQGKGVRRQSIRGWEREGCGMLFSPHSRLEMEEVKDLPLQVKICFFWRNKSFISCFIKLFFKNGIVRFITLIFENFINHYS